WRLNTPLSDLLQLVPAPVRRPLHRRRCLSIDEFLSAYSPVRNSQASAPNSHASHPKLHPISVPAEWRSSTLAEIARHRGHDGRLRTPSSPDKDDKLNTRPRSPA